jgi:hypothetical protein
MRRPTLLSKEEVKSGPYIVAIRDSRVAAGEDNDFYAQGLEQAIDGSRYNIVHVGEALRDPETNKVLGYRGRYIGAGTVTGAGQVAKLRAGMTEVEALRGDKLFAEDITVATDFIPHPVAEDFHGTILGVDGVYATGKYGVVAVNRGAKDGMEPGHVLAIKQKGDTVPDHFANGGQASYWSYGRKVKLPDERIGVVMLFKVHEQLSYGLVMDTTHPVRVGDLVATP